MKLEVDTDIIELDSGHTIMRSHSRDITKGTILHLHGLPGGKFSEYNYLHNLFAPRGYRIISFNYPGLWGADGTFSPRTAISATEALLDHMETTYEGKIVIFAESLGGYVGVRALSDDSVVSHILHRAPVPGFEFIEKDDDFKMQLSQSLALLVQSGVISVDDTDIDDVLKDPTTSSFDSKLGQIQEQDVKQLVIVGDNDEILPTGVIKSTFEPYAEVVIFDSLSHNDISRSEWIDIVTRADIFYQS